MRLTWNRIGMFLGLAVMGAHSVSGQSLSPERLSAEVDTAPFDSNQTDSSDNGLAPFAPQAASAILPDNLIKGPDDWLFENETAMQLVIEARQSDPRYSPLGQQDRDAAIKKYEEAMAAQPGAKVNAVIADRIAQLLAFTANPQASVTPNPKEAAKWWERCTLMSSSNQLLWAQAKMGLASSGVMQKSPQESISYMREILEIDPDLIELENWKSSFYSTDMTWRKQERQRLRTELIALQENVRKKIGYLEKAIQSRATIREEKQRAKASMASTGDRWTWIAVLNSAVLLALISLFAIRKRAQKN